MKTLDEIINRQDYKRMTANLEKRVVEVAKLMAKKIAYLELKELKFKKYDDELVIGYDRNHVGPILFQKHWHTYKDAPGEYLLHDLSEHTHRYGYIGVRNPTTRMYLDFLNHARSMFDELDEYETEMFRKMENTIKDTNDIK